jgi:hypothetical protein
MPEVIVIDEIGTEQEAYAARTIAERGVQLVGTAHGRTLENLMLNPTLCDLVGGIQAVTLSDDEAKRRGTQKTVLERKAPPTFDVIIELLDYDKLAIHHDAQKQVDLVLRGVAPRPEIRVRTPEGRVEIVQAAQTPEPMEPVAKPIERRKPVEREEIRPEPKPMPNVIRVFAYGIARTRLERAIREKHAPLAVANDLTEADAVITMKAAMSKKPTRFRERLGRNVPTVVIRSNTLSQIEDAIDEILTIRNGDSPPEQVDNDVSEAIEFVKSKGKPFELAPRPGSVRKLQHRAVEAARMRSESVGQEPNRRVRVLPLG